MTEKKCKYCAMMIPDEAKICPHCRKPQGWTRPAKSCLAGMIIIAFLMIVANYNSPPSSINSNAKQEITLTEKGKKIKVKYSHWSNEVCNTVAAKEIHRGMTAEQVKAAWGKPQRNNESVGKWGTHEQWVYGDTYVYFENGLITSWQSSK